jgi:hypothetical protein
MTIQPHAAPPPRDTALPPGAPAPGSVRVCACGFLGTPDAMAEHRAGSGDPLCRLRP